MLLHYKVIIGAFDVEVITYLPYSKRVQVQLAQCVAIHISYWS